MKFVCCLSKTFKKYGILKVQRNLLFHTEFKISIHPLQLSIRQPEDFHGPAPVSVLREGPELYAEV